MKDSFPVLTEHRSISSGLVTVPLIREGQIDGYLMAEVSLTANDEAFLHREDMKRMCDPSRNQMMVMPIIDKVFLDVVPLLRNHDDSRPPSLRPGSCLRRT